MNFTKVIHLKLIIWMIQQASFETMHLGVKKIIM
jgi:hypothetical protein